MFQSNFIYTKRQLAHTLNRMSILPNHNKAWYKYDFYSLQANIPGTVGSKPRIPGFKSHFCHFSSLWSWEVTSY